MLRKLLAMKRARTASVATRGLLATSETEHERAQQKSTESATLATANADALPADPNARESRRYIAAAAMTENSERSASRARTAWRGDTPAWS